ncbi:MAG: hypothetical protein WBN72_11595 [Nitrososphaeraceae archaeon]
MTKFDEIMDIITHNKNKNKGKKSVDALKGQPKSTLNTNEDFDIEVSGTDLTSAPLITAADDSLDPDIIDMLYTKPGWRNIPNRGENASSWDSDY